MCLKVWSRQRHDLPTPGVPSNAAAGDVNPKISNRVRGQTVKPQLVALPPPPHTPEQPHPTKTRPSKFYEEHGHHKKKRWAVGGQYAHEIKKKKMGV